MWSGNHLKRDAVHAKKRLLCLYIMHSDAKVRYFSDPDKIGIPCQDCIYPMSKSSSRNQHVKVVYR